MVVRFIHTEEGRQQDTFGASFSTHFVLVFPITFSRAQLPAKRSETRQINVAHPYRAVSVSRYADLGDCNSPNVGTVLALSRGLQVDDSTLQSESDSVRPIMGAQLGENVLDVALYGLLADRQFIGDQFVGISRCNQ